jgi:hypothetical protein
VHGGRAGGFVARGDGVDVVSVGRAYVAADGELPSDVVDVGESVGEVGAAEVVASVAIRSAAAAAV